MWQATQGCLAYLPFWGSLKPLRAYAAYQPCKGSGGDQSGRRLTHPARRVSEAHSDCQRVRHLPFGADGGRFPVDDRTGLQVYSLVGVASARLCRMATA